MKDWIAARRDDDLDYQQGVSAPTQNTAADNHTATLYRQFADQARQQGITDPNEIHNFAASNTRQAVSQIAPPRGNWLQEHAWATPLLAMGAMYGGGALLGEAGAAGAGGVAGGAEGAAATGAGDIFGGGWTADAGAWGGGTTTGAASSGAGGGMFDDFTGGWDGGGDYVPGPEDGYTGGGGDYVPGPEDGYTGGTGGSSGLPSMPPGTSGIVNQIIGGGGSKPQTKPGVNTGGSGGATNGLIAGGVGALVGNNLTGGGGFASRNDAASGNFDNEAALANQLWQTYQQQYGGPSGITTQAINDARNIDSEANQSRVMGAAHADSAQSTDAAGRAAIERLRQYGVNPSSDRLASLNAQIQASGAAADAGSQTMARQHLVDTGIAARQKMAEMGNALPGAAMTGLYSAGVGNTRLGSTTYDQAKEIGQGIGSMIQPAVGGISDWLGSNGGVSGVAGKVGDWLNGSGGTSGNTPQPRLGFEPWLGGNNAPGGGFMGGQVDFGNEQPAPGTGSEQPMRVAYNPNPATAPSPGKRYAGGSPTFMEGGYPTRTTMGSGAGYKRGGLVRGAGTGTSDSVPAIGANNEPIRLSNNEYIIPADVVRHKGVEFFDRIVGKIHQPVATGVRRA